MHADIVPPQSAIFTTTSRMGKLTRADREGFASNSPQSNGPRTRDQRPMTERNSIVSAIESKDQQTRSFGDYRSLVQKHYDGLPGALTAVTGLVTGHEALAGRLIRPDG